MGRGAFYESIMPEAELRALYESGLSWRKIAKNLGISAGSLSAWAKRKGIPPRDSREYYGDPIVRLWSNVKRGQPDECWPWLGRQNTSGYGRFKAHGKSYIAHRYLYLNHIGVAETRLVVMHSCDNPLCCNPAHLSLGTRADNNHDMMMKGRANFGGKRRPALGVSP